MAPTGISKMLLHLFNFFGILIAFTIPFNLLLNSYIIATFVVLFIINVAYKNFTYKKGSSKLFILFISFYLLEILSLFYSDNKDEGVFILQKKIALLLFPLLLAFINEVNIRSILKGFVLGCLFACILCLFHSTEIFFDTKNVGEFFYENLSAGIGIHHVYFSLHLAFALLVLLEDIQNHATFSFVKKAAIFFGVALLFTCIVLLSARTLLVAITFILLYKVFFVFLKKKTLWVKSAVFAVLLSGGYLVVYFSPTLKSRILDVATSKFYFSPEENNANALTLRIVKWQCSMEGIKHHPLTGVGVGDAQDFLQDCYSKKNFWGQVFKYNSHNQYLQTGLYAGVFSIMFYLLALIIPLVIAIKEKKYLFVEFLMLIIMAGLTESLLERQHGVVFYAFFNSLLAFHVSKQS